MKWIKRTGDEMPVSGDTLVLIKLRNGTTSSQFLKASEFRWWLNGGAPDIIEYALLEGEEQKDQEPKLTPWIDGNIKPVCAGVYERDYRCSIPCYCRFDGSSWYFVRHTIEEASEVETISTFQDLLWRSVAQKL